ncbi:acyl-CoA synthetase (AMP-forming)/AMP-acid ligase II [Saprospira grandis DSM 2844]|uniref:Acyl-CoA synthetase (AMP-forming)/AMP-acid ligase II n=2 Tax=Saprospira TaxID=1007 RepID=J0P271_9BACT|nr:acyl-CoA synthetase (AMP-forming)/AMP-acid ligase II [Saprospira grandis DSM 2844]
MIQLPFVQQAEKHRNRKAITDENGSYTYHYLLQASASLAAYLLNGRADLAGARVAFMISPSIYFVASQWAIWRAGGVAVPIHLSYPLPAVEFLLEDTGAEILVVDRSHKKQLEGLEDRLNIQVFTIEELLNDLKECNLPIISPKRNALIIYTSGTSSRPKGVLSTHEIIQAQIEAQVQAWEWQKTDHILNILPLHHVHGLINALACPLWVGACCTFHEEFEERKVFSTLEAGRVNVFMAVPTIYYKLINTYKELHKYQQKHISSVLANFRLMVSGSAALPVQVLKEWQTISDHRLLERYGMTEIGMALSNPYNQQSRVPGHVGQPLPGVELRLWDEEQGKAITKENEAGEIQVKGPTVFKEYWNRPEYTANSFTQDGWFQTGDIAILEKGSYRIMGRKSIDIIKSGGYKISALELEEIMREHPLVKDCAVLGLENIEWGEIVAAAVIPNTQDAETLEPLLNEWLRQKLPAYKLVRRFLLLQELPRNTMGKVNKPSLKKMFEDPNNQH